ncbi:MAG: hypothetical protein PHS61_02025 [Candidatus Omnitrophica bacterium]|nr:hypothetical protein [Candidatus Omnitrophota bacterium]
MSSTMGKFSLRVFLGMLLGAAAVVLGVVLTVRYFDLTARLVLACAGPVLVLAGFVVLAVSRE